jgi:hypothetical protein
MALIHIKAVPGCPRGMLAAMPPKIVEFTSDKRFERRERELKTIETMVHMYCRGHRHLNAEPLCRDCAELFEYATRRLQRCVFGDTKPTCANCLVHCYSAEKRDRVRMVMRWAGPRMLFRHPVLALFHKLDGRRPTPALPARTTKPQNDRTQST